MPEAFASALTRAGYGSALNWLWGTIRFATRIANFSNMNVQEPVDGLHGTIRFATRIANFSNMNDQEPFGGSHGTIRFA